MINKTLVIIISICLSLFFSNSSNTIEPDEILQDQKQEFRAREISKNIRCMVCQNQSIDESNAPLAKDLRILIRNKIKEGNNNQEIYIFLIYSILLIFSKIISLLFITFLPTFSKLTGTLLLIID